MDMTDATHKLFAQLEGPQKRRLYFLLLAIEKSTPADALAVAKDMERYVVGMSGPSEKQAVTDEAASSGNRQTDAGRRAVATEATVSCETDVKTGAADRQVPGKPERQSTDLKFRQEFVDACASGADNRELASRFGLTPRQAQGMRMGLTRNKAAAPARYSHDEDPKERNGLSTPTFGPDRANDIQQQEEFLRNRPSTPPTMDDVIRFLRQIGDTIVSQDGGFLINSRVLLTRQQLLQRANEKRLARGKPTFDLSEGHVCA